MSGSGKAEDPPRPGWWPPECRSRALSGRAWAWPAAARVTARTRVALASQGAAGLRSAHLVAVRARFKFRKASGAHRVPDARLHPQPPQPEPDSMLGPRRGGRTLRSTDTGPPGPAAPPLGTADPGRPSTYPQNQLLGGRGHEHAVTPRRAPRAHVLLALAGVLAVRVAEDETQAVSAGRSGPTLAPAGDGRGHPRRGYVYRSFRDIKSSPRLL